MPEKDRFPIRYGRGHSKVTIYNRTTALPYFRLCYRFGPVRHQSTFNCLEQPIIYRHYQALIDDPQLAQDWFAIKLNANALKEFHGED